LRPGESALLGELLGLGGPLRKLALLVKVASEGGLEGIPSFRQVIADGTIRELLRPGWRPKASERVVEGTKARKAVELGKRIEVPKIEVRKPVGPTTLGDLTPRQREVLGLVVAGLDDEQIGVRLGIQRGTVAGYVADLRTRVGADSRMGLVYWARTQGLKPPPPAATPPPSAVAPKRGSRLLGCLWPIAVLALLVLALPILLGNPAPNSTDAPAKASTAVPGLQLTTTALATETAAAKAGLLAGAATATASSQLTATARVVPAAVTRASPPTATVRSAVTAVIPTLPPGTMAPTRIDSVRMVHNQLVNGLNSLVIHVGLQVSRTESGQVWVVALFFLGDGSRMPVQEYEFSDVDPQTWEEQAAVGAIVDVDKSVVRLDDLSLFIPYSALAVGQGLYATIQIQDVATSRLLGQRRTETFSRAR
jgi:DNA-binding CsgD family transcriptional regulator